MDDHLNEFAVSDESAQNTDAQTEYTSSPETGNSEPQKKPNRHSRLLRTIILAFCSFLFVISLFVALVVGYIYKQISPFINYDLIFPNVYCAGIDLGGMTKIEASAAIQAALSAPSYSVTVDFPDCSYVFAPAQTGTITNANEISEIAYAYLRTDTSPYGLYKAYRKASKSEYRLNASANFTYNVDDIVKQATEISEGSYIAPTESSSTYDSELHTASVTLGSPGRSISSAAIASSVCNAFDTMNFETIYMEYDAVPIDYEALEAVCTDACIAAASAPTEPSVTINEEDHSITVTAGTPGYESDSTELYELATSAAERGTYGTLTVTLNEIEPEEPDIYDAVDAIFCEPTEPYYADGAVQEGKNGYKINYNNAIAEVNNLSYGETVEIEPDVSYPTMTADEVRSVLFRDTLASYSSPHTNNYNRTQNLIQACKAINGTVLNAGESFSFNDIVGERTAEKGYREGTVYVGTDSQSELGGGICQVASTIYCAVLYANLQVTVRAPHIYFVTYVPGGLDATVYYGAQDFCFRNNTDYPVRINASVSGGSVHISLDGTDVNNYTVKLTSKKLSATKYTTKKVYSADYPKGYYEYVSPYTGYKYEAYQYVYNSAGDLIATNYLGISDYQKRDRTYIYGTG